MLPILSYGCEVWGVDTKCGVAAEALHWDFSRRLLGVRKFTANHMVLAELGHKFTSGQILRYHHRTIALDNVRLVKLAMVDGFALIQTAVRDSWQHYLGGFLHGHSGQQQLFHKFDIASVIERAKHQHAFEYSADDQHSRLMLYRPMQLEYIPAEYLSVVNCASNRRLMSRFRTACLGLRVDTRPLGRQ